MKLIFSLGILLLSSSLFAQWSLNPALNTPVCKASGKQNDLRMMEDGKGGTYITWKDYRSGLSNPDIYIQRVNSKGITLWTTNGIPLCTDPADQSTPNIISDMNGGAIVAWSDWRNGTERDLYAQRIDSNGTILWTVQGANVSNLPPREHSEKLVSDNHGGAIVVFEKQLYTNNLHWEIWAQRLDSAGNKKWGQGGVSLSLSNTNKRNHKAQKDRNGGAIIAWQDLDSVTNQYNIYAQRVDANGNLLWGPNGKVVCNAVGDQINAKIDPDSLFNGAFVAWQDTRNTLTSDYDIYIQRLDSMGNAKWAPNGNAVCVAANNQSALDLMSISSTNETIITWKDNRGADYDIYAQKFNALGLAQWTNNGLLICNAVKDQINPNIATDENKGAVIVWQDSSLGAWDVRAQRVSNAGTLLWANNGEWVCTANGEQSSPKNCTDGQGGSIFAWQDKRTDTFDIYVHHLFSSGSPNGLQTIKEEPLGQVYPNPTSDDVFIEFMNPTRHTRVTLFDLAGKQLQNLSTSAVQVQLSLRNLPAGMYLLQIQNETQCWHQRILKQ